jgi:predicted tellurium resistance membrane protein TerC
VDFNWARSFDRTLHREEPAEPSKKHIVVAWAAGIVAVLFMGTVAALLDQLKEKYTWHEFAK